MEIINQIIANPAIPVIFNIVKFLIISTGIAPNNKEVIIKIKISLLLY